MGCFIVYVGESPTPLTRTYRPRQSRSSGSRACSSGGWFRFGYVVGLVPGGDLPIIGIVRTMVIRFFVVLAIGIYPKPQQSASVRGEYPPNRTPVRMNILNRLPTPRIQTPIPRLHRVGSVPKGATIQPRTPILPQHPTPTRLLHPQERPPPQSQPPPPVTVPTSTGSQNRWVKAEMR